MTNMTRLMHGYRNLVKLKNILMMVGILVVFCIIWRRENSDVLDNERITDPCVPVNMIVGWLNDLHDFAGKTGKSRICEVGDKNV